MRMIIKAKYYDVVCCLCLKGSQGIKGPQRIQGEIDPSEPKSDPGTTFTLYNKPWICLSTDSGQKEDNGIIGSRGSDVRCISNSHIIVYRCL